MDNAGAFGFVQLAKNKINGQLVAIKFLERGPDKVRIRQNKGALLIVFRAF